MKVNVLHIYLKQSHVGAIVAVSFVVVCVVDEGAVFLRKSITCGRTGRNVVLVYTSL